MHGMRETWIDQARLPRARRCHGTNFVSSSFHYRYFCYAECIGTESACDVERNGKYGACWIALFFSEDLTSSAIPFVWLDRDVMDGWEEYIYGNRHRYRN